MSGYDYPSTRGIKRGPNARINSILMTLDADRKRCALVVEGSDDIKSLERHMAAECNLELIRGRSNVEEAIIHASRRLEAKGRILGVVDADFDRIDDRPSPSSFLERTTWHDLDVEYLTSPAALQVIAEHAGWRLSSIESALGNTVTAWALGEAAKLGTIKWACNHASHWYRRLTSFKSEKGFRLLEHLDTDDWGIDLKSAAASAWQGAEASDERGRYLNAVLQDAQRVSDWDSMHLANGHDLSLLIAFAVTGPDAWRRLRPGQRPEKDLEQNIRSRMTSEEFADLPICRVLQGLGQRNDTRLVMVPN